MTMVEVTSEDRATWTLFIEFAFEYLPWIILRYKSGIYREPVASFVEHCVRITKFFIEAPWSLIVIEIAITSLTSLSSTIC